MPADFNPEDLIGRRNELKGQCGDPVTIQSIDDQGDGITLRVRTLPGDPKDTTVERDELAVALAAAEASPRATEFVKPEDQFLLFDSPRIRLAGTSDPQSDVPLSGIGPLADQLEDVYAQMPLQTCLRYLAQWRRILQGRAPLFDHAVGGVDAS